MVETRPDKVANTCPRCGRIFPGRVFFCGGCGYLRDSDNHSVGEVLTPKGRALKVIRTTSKNGKKN